MLKDVTGVNITGGCFKNHANLPLFDFSTGNKIFLEQYANSYIRKSLDSSYSTESTLLREEIVNFSRFDSDKHYNIFLSHSYQDKTAILGLAMKLKNECNYKVYLDWIEDKTLDRSNVTRATAKRLKGEMPTVHRS